MTAKDALAGTTNTNVVAGVSDGKRATKFIVFGELAKGIEKVEQLQGHQSDAPKKGSRTSFSLSGRVLNPSQCSSLCERW